MVTYDDKVLFTISALANAMAAQTGPDLGDKLYDAIVAGLAKAAPDIGKWDVVWGPAVLQFESDGLLQNAIYVASQVDPPTKKPRYVVSIAGTNRTSMYDWFVEDFMVHRQLPWIYALLTAPHAKISLSTAIGLATLLSLEPAGKRPGQGRITDFLEGVAAKGDVDVVTVGHSLGGALSATMALMLHDTRGNRRGWDPDKHSAISSMPTAGPTAGNEAFARHSDLTIGRSLSRLSNALDVVPHAWNAETLQAIKAIYAPEIESKAVDDLIDFALNATKNGSYTQPNARAEWLPGTFDSKIYDPKKSPIVNFFAQLAYQHTTAYEQWFGFGGAQTAAAVPEIDPHEIARLFSRAGIALPDELKPYAPRALRPRVAVGTRWVDAPEGAGDPRLEAIEAGVMKILEEAAPPAEG